LGLRRAVIREPIFDEGKISHRRVHQRAKGRLPVFSDDDIPPPCIFGPICVALDVSKSFIDGEW
jgi:hypothetical protein